MGYVMVACKMFRIAEVPKDTYSMIGNATVQKLMLTASLQYSQKRHQLTLYFGDMMYPDVYPSPTPSRDNSPSPSISPASGSPGSDRIVPLRSIMSSSSRARPPFIESQSEPVLASTSSHSTESRRAYLSPTASPISIYYAGTKRRRVSEPIQVQKRDKAAGNVAEPPDSEGKARVFSNPVSVSAPPGSPSDQLEGFPNIGLLNRSPEQNRQSGLHRRPITPQTVHSVNAQLMQKLKEPITSSDTRGVVYLIRDKNNPERGLKIGSTTRTNCETRFDEHRSQCKINLQEVMVSSEVKHPIRMEKLIHIDLSDKRRLWQCAGHKKKGGLPHITSHEEWFQVTEEDAIDTLKKWERFMNEQSPYNWRGQLRTLWSYLLRSRGVSHLGFAGQNHSVRKKQWFDVLARPTLLDRSRCVQDQTNRRSELVVRKVSYWWPYIEAMFWQMPLIMYSTSTLIWFHSLRACVAFLLTLGFTCISVLRQKQLAKGARIRRAK